MEGAGTVDCDLISLSPRHTWKNRPGGLRADMVQVLADMHPGFMRFPGGCIVEGPVLSRRYQWKNTIGPVEDRQLLVNRWNMNLRTGPRRIISSRSASAFLNSSNCARTSARSRCRS